LEKSQNKFTARKKLEKRIESILWWPEFEWFQQKKTSPASNSQNVPTVQSVTHCGQTVTDASGFALFGTRLIRFRVFAFAIGLGIAIAGCRRRYLHSRG
jgi:hypothetical protein